MPTTQAAAVTPRAIGSALPQLGQAWPGIAGVYAGVTTDKEGALYALVLLDAKAAGDLEWKPALAWAESVGGDLPNRVEGALLFANLKGRFEESYHWLNEAHSDSYAWLQSFNYGTQHYGNKSHEFAAVAVRRLPLDSFNPLAGAKQLTAEGIAKLRSAAAQLLSAVDVAEEVVESLPEAA